MIRDKTSLSKKYSSLFILDEGKLRKLVDVLSEYSKKKDYECKVRFTVNKADNSEYVTDSIETVLKDDNVKRKEIRKLTIVVLDKEESRSNTWNPDCEVVFEDVDASSYSVPVKYTVKGADEDWAFSLAEGLDVYIQRALISENKRLNRLFSFIDNTLVPIIYFLLGLFLISLVYPIKQRHFSDLTLIEVGVIVAICTGLILISFDTLSGVKPFERLSNLTKVSSVFYWGDQKEAHDSQRSFRQNIKWVVIIGFLVSAAAGVLVAVLLNR